MRGSVQGGRGIRDPDLSEQLRAAQVMSEPCCVRGRCSWPEGAQEDRRGANVAVMQVVPGEIGRTHERCACEPGHCGVGDTRTETSNDMGDVVVCRDSNANLARCLRGG